MEFVFVQRLLRFSSCYNSQNCATLSREISATCSMVKSVETDCLTDRHQLLSMADKHDVHFSEPGRGPKACFVCGCLTEDRRSVE